MARQTPPGVPQYVVDYAPVVYLHSQDPYRPSDIAAHLTHTQPDKDFAVVSGGPDPLTLDNLDQLNGLDGANIYLTSKDDVTTDPAWLKGVTPTDGKTKNAIASVIITVDKGNGLLDAFYMYFYSWNYGGAVNIPILGVKNFGNHVGDWEHNMVRFQDGQPTHAWYSQHANGQAFTWSALQKSGNRPIAFSANGSHATYATTGEHDHTIPNLVLPDGIFLIDYTDEGPVWDPTLNAWYYSYDNASKVFTPYEEGTPTAFLKFVGKWGDQQYPDDDPRQYVLFGQAKYSGGPIGPEDKDLGREKVCPDNGNDCIIRPTTLK
ncbi:hypothetical protein K402DRAFT_396309 [Aulographum hederae CBS 113979]|uniref:Vacuolar protein sorting-associated protein 62 n=1 Tax=Aulographum hederae CBS 113979 TaxID=1176131 RepID=A0A6G1GSQ6_9PEZI|nr:hypothetical protein K402DRAFT_396309 [Aulographum hederae CBS 113979]